MYKPAQHIDPYGEIPGALRRAAQQSARTSPSPSATAKFVAVGSLALGVMISDPLLTAVFLLAGSIALWFTFRREDRVAESSLDAHFDSRTGLALAESLPLILDDSNVIRSLTGRLAVAAIDVPEIARRELAGDRSAAQALLAATTHRLRTNGWSGEAVGPFGPVIFLRRPSVFLVILRDVLDERTTGWLAERVLTILNEPVPWQGGKLEPGAVMGLAVGDVAAADDLLLAAGDARVRARRNGEGSLVVHGPALRPVPSRGFAVELADGTAARVVGTSTTDGELFTEVRNLPNRLNETLRSIERGGNGYLSLSPSTLCHRNTVERIRARVVEAGATGRFAVVVPGNLDDHSFLEAWRSIDSLRDAGIDVLIDRTDPLSAGRPFPDHTLDGVVIDSRNPAVDAELVLAEADRRGMRVLQRSAPQETPVPAGAVSTTQSDQGPSTPVLTLAGEAPGTRRPNFGGRSDQPAQGAGTPAR